MNIQQCGSLLQALTPPLPPPSPPTTPFVPPRRPLQLLHFASKDNTTSMLKPNKVLNLVQRGPWICRVFALTLNNISPHSKINVLNITILGDLDLRPDMMPH